MFIRSLDYLSPPITLYYKGSNRHRSIFSGILTVLCYASVVAVFIIFITQLFDKSSPTAFYANKFIADTGETPMDTRMLFHYYETLDFDTVPKKDFVKYFRIQAKTNLTGPDYWLYDYCTEEDFGHLYNEEAFADVHGSVQERLCIRYYWKDSESRFLKTGDPDFEYPKIMHGLNHPEYNYYKAFLSSCENGTEMDDVLGPCEDEETILPFRQFHVIGFVFADHDVDVNNYDKPIKVLNYKFWSSKYWGQLWTNQLNLNPIQINTHKGLISDRIEETHSLAYANHGWGTENKENGTNHIYNVYVMNRQFLYDRQYKKLPEVLASIGGLTQVVVTVATFINFVANRYCQFLDCELDLINYKMENKKNVNKGDLISPDHKVAKTKDYLNSSPKIYHIQMAEQGKQNENKEIKEEDLSKKQFILSSNSQKKNLNEGLFSLANNKKPKETSRNAYKPKTVGNDGYFNISFFKKVNFCDFLFYICCASLKKDLYKKQKYIKFVEQLSELIVSEETLFDIHFYLEYYNKNASKIEVENLLDS